MDVLDPEIEERREDQAHQIIEYRRRLAPEVIGKKAEAREADQRADVLDQSDQCRIVLRRQRRGGRDRSDIGGHEGRHAPIADGHRQRHHEGEQEAHAHRGLGEHVDQREANQCRVLALERRALPAQIVGGAAAPVRVFPARRFRNVAPDPKDKQRRQHADQIHVAPRAGAGAADQEPDAGGKNAADRVSRLQKGAALAARLGRPQLGRDRGAGRPFRADREPDEKAQHAKGQPIPGKRAQAGEQRIGEDRKRHRALAAEIVG